MEIEDSTGNRWKVPGDHFMNHSIGFLREKVVYKLDFPMNEKFADWLILLSNEKKLNSVAKEVKEISQEIKNSRFLTLAGLVSVAPECILPEYIENFLSKLSTLPTPPRELLEFAGYIYAIPSFKNVMYLWKKRDMKSFIPCYSKEFQCSSKKKSNKK